MQAPRILSVSNISNAGGAEKVLLDTIELTASSFDHVLLAPRGGLLEESRRRRMRVHRSWGLRELERSRSWWWPLEVAIAFPIAMLEIVVHAIIGRVALIHANNFAAGLYALPAARLTRKPTIWTIHDLFPPGSREGRALRWFSRASDRVVAVSQAVGDSLIAHGVDPAKIVVIPNAIDLQGFDPTRYAKGAFRSRHRLEENDVVVATVGQITPGKGIHILLEVARKIHSALRIRFVIAGTAPRAHHSFEAQLRREVERDPVLRDRVLFVGGLSDPAELLADADVLLHPAVHPEAFGLAVLEAMAMELVVVAPRSGGIVEIVEDGTGVLFEPGNVDDISRQMERVLEDPERAGMGRKARSHVKSRFDVTRRAQSLLELYRSLIN